MALCTSVKLPRSYTPTFPDQCIACGELAPGGFLEVSTQTVGLFTLITLHPGSRFSANVPACPICAQFLRRRKRFRTLLTWGLAIVGVAIAFYILKSYHGIWRRWIAAAIAFPCCLPLIIWETLRPLPIDLTAFGKSIDYEFRDRAYAYAFAELNSEYVRSIE